jgi:RimJ/RimL family protein N-acetyltransferase
MIGDLISLRPLAVEDATTLWDAIGPVSETWQWVGHGSPMPESAEDLANLFHKYLQRTTAQYFAIVDNYSGTVIGATAFLDIRPDDHHCEIGSTFIVPIFRGGNRNVEAKFLMLTEAFEQRDCVRVTIKANALNTRSRTAIEKLGAKFEGLIRNQRLERDGTWRTAAYYSVTVEDWPETKLHLQRRLGQALPVA